jgi:hypothetical protein
MSRRVVVHHFVANLTTRQYGPHPTSDLLGVDYRFDVPADTEFPRFFPRIDLFTRFYLHRAKPVEFKVRVLWLDAPAGVQNRARSYGPFPVPFQRTDQVIDHSFRLVNVRIEGAGRYEVLLLRRHNSNFEAGVWIRCAETHFFVER